MSKHQNLHPNTPFGLFFNHIGLWHPKFDKGVVDAYNQLHDAEKAAITDASGVIAVLNKTIGQAPEFVFAALSKAFPALTKEVITDFLNKLNSKLELVSDNTPADFDTAIATLQEWLGKWQGETWADITRAAVNIGASILKNGLSIKTIAEVASYVYQAFIKDKVA